MTPQFNQMPVVANIQEQIENGETVTIGFSLNTLVVEGYGAIELL
ncbi:MAG: 3-deoxy-D-arabino-heptulosonate 7-phosphate (DAHP) synthase [Pseudomonadales bacterium]|jgi:3-deoxy-D-arabino-heptulosonate 7-phosphate (DAHP) synthase